MYKTVTKTATTAIGLSLLVVGCGSSDVGTTGSGGSTAGDAVKVAIITSGAANDVGWNQNMIEQAEKLEQAGEIELIVVQQGYDITAEETIQAATDLAEDGNQIVVAHSFNYGEPLKTMIDEYPDVLFAYAGGFGDSTENLADYSQPFFEGAFLAGILSGGVTKTGVLGGTAGFDIPVCHSMLTAFAEGAKLSYQAGDVELKSAYIGNWGDVAKTKEAVIAMADQGADQFITCGVDAGTIEGVKEVGGNVIGYTMDQSPLAPDNVLASIVWNLDEVLRKMVADVKSGDINPARYYEVGYADGGISIVINEALEDTIPDETLALYEEFSQRMADGSFKAPYIAK